MRFLGLARRSSSFQIRAMTSARLAANSSSVSRPSSCRLASLRSTAHVFLLLVHADIAPPVRVLLTDADTTDEAPKKRGLSITHGKPALGDCGSPQEVGHYEGKAHRQLIAQIVTVLGQLLMRPGHADGVRQTVPSRPRR
jgi:hypothetical protein